MFESIFTSTLAHYQWLFSRTAHYKTLTELKGKIIHIVELATISLCLNLFSWASFRVTKGAIKIYTQLDEQSELPGVVYISEGRMHDRRGIDHLSIQSGSVLIDDRGYYDFDAFVNYFERNITFVTRIKANADFKTCKQEELTKEDLKNGVRSSQIIQMRGNKAFDSTLCDYELRLVTVWDKQNQKELNILTNNPDWSVWGGELYKRRWKVELFFNALKQNLQVKTFIGTS